MNKGKCPFPGISFYKRTSKWRVQVRVQGKPRHFGYYGSLSEAIVKSNEIFKRFYGGLAQYWRSFCMSAEKKIIVQERELLEKEFNTVPGKETLSEIKKLLKGFEK